MKISGSYTVPVAQERAYSLLQDPEVLSTCMPGVDALNRIGDDDYEMSMKLSIAGMEVSSPAGYASLTNSLPPASGYRKRDRKNRLHER